AEVISISLTANWRNPRTCRYTEFARGMYRGCLERVRTIRKILFIRDIRMIRDYSGFNELLDRHLWISVLGVEGQFLSGRSAHREDAFVLRRAICNDRDQLHVSQDSRGEDNRKLENANAGQISLCTKSAAKNHALGKIARLRKHRRVFLQSGD